ncbi:MAG: glycosyltransferase [Candidatus Latescibacter sp.]|nr:glycosyltransferase [Candidatus Latescibacter sp.]
MLPKVSIIIAVGIPGRYVEECVARCLALDSPDFEIIVLPDREWTPPDRRVRVIPTGKVHPAEKRDRGVKNAAGEIVAIIDDDAWPEPDWLAKAVRHFEADERVAAVGGPGMTPPGDNLKQHISGWIYESPLVSGGFTYRYRPERIRDVDDYPTSSLIIRKSDFLAAGGFDTGYWPGEDTILCLKLTHEMGKRIVYDPEVRVYHHRREIYLPHLRQIRSYALHRGFFARKFPQTSLKMSYFVPSLFTVFFFLGWMTAWTELFPVWAGVMLLYCALNAAFSLKAGSLRGIFGVFAGTFLTHVTYGIWFLLGLFAKELRD